MKLLVCGGRDYTDQDRVWRALDQLDAKRKIFLLVHGDCRDREGNPCGADHLADLWARARLVARLPFPVTQEEWRRLGRAAGPRRNQQMLDISQPDGAVAFPGGRGTEDMCRRLEVANVKVWHPYGRTAS